MSVAKHLSYARSRTERPRRIDGSSFAHLHIHDNETIAAWQRQAPSSPQFAIAVASVAASPSLFKSVAQLAEAAGGILLAVASWMLMKIFDGCVAYAMAMHGIPADLVYEDSPYPEPSAPLNFRNSSRLILHVIEAETERQIGAHEIPSALEAAQPCAAAERAAQSEPMPTARSRWHSAIIAPAVLLLSKIRESNARRRAVAELGSLDDRSLRDIGISRGDISYIARYGAPPE